MENTKLNRNIWGRDERDYPYLKSQEIVINSKNFTINGKLADIETDSDNYFIENENGERFGSIFENSSEAFKCILNNFFKDVKVIIINKHGDIITQERIDEIVKKHNDKIA